MRMPASAPRGTVLGACAASLLAVALPASTGAQPRSDGTTVVVTMTDSKLTVAPQYVPPGPVVFEIANKGTIGRDFKIGGKKTSKLAPGKSATLTVDVNTQTNYPYYSTGRGHATLSGVIVVVPVPCAKPITSTIAVKMTDGPIKLSQTRVPCGTVKFVLTNAGKRLHAFTVQDTGSPDTAPGGAGPALKAGKTATITVHFSYEGPAYYYDREPGRAALYGERGFLIVY